MTTTDEQTIPATVTLALRCWAVLAGAKFLALVFQGVAGLYPQSAARETLGENIPEGIDPAVYAKLAGFTGLVLNSAFGLLFAGLIGFFAYRVWQGKKQAFSANFTLQLFSGILIIDAAMGITVATALGVPTWLTLAIGWVQILILVSAVMGIYFSTRHDTRTWVEAHREIEQRRR
ncbi:MULTISPECIES: hypothetical protein [Corynebacterium]|uniref:Uncharacterized protein n=2 Tax=Corynebacterium glucuronolyticum TaxID=39791 RepID=A0A7T4EFN9_9CORY|nr:MULTISPECIES: hypothetical protein [Corynebacterium]EEI28156.1 hypothetical protein HMPREF0294_0336 [Corynebacterium glucuronolyticum ATCC 51867]EEI63586.1 hypothetical protein HMPREF0293_0965 [Corynebacterium glucuronolyticum ATCC 51866]MCT1442583.1 hypothetical protein [Corynebacterium glucuronolyticum]MCT1564560.1 hypothetical protein [Corynebacterium glucuronolyticum]OFO46819.1 hypothetical protein HMPREF3044_01485 [Corynebacterium sp. HMSC073D01]